ncbi:hypothetical protein JW992_12015, partial [candidate division KSB1 bacterium]|nr:hypothetical protein [candidate division KSB1 bacterium]
MTLFGFASRGFYLHTCWRYRHPFAVRTWTAADYHNWFVLMRMLQFDQVMIWPVAEMAPPPLTVADRESLQAFAAIVDDAHCCGLTCRLVFCPNLTSHTAIAAQPFHDRVFYPYMRRLRLDNPEHLALLLSHHEAILSSLSNADGYVYIDGDPGSYPGALPKDYISFLASIRDILQRVHRGPTPPTIIPWIWSGWGSDWETLPPWQDDLARFVDSFLHAWRSTPPREPWELLPGRSVREGWANGRINFELVEAHGLLPHSTLLTYEIVEFEPTPPGLVMQFDEIRRVLQQEYRLASRVRGIVANAQQPIMALPNLFYFARCAADPRWLSKSDQEVLIAFSEFLGGDVDLISLACSASNRSLQDLPADLPKRLTGMQLKAESARCLPGGAESYTSILSEFVEVRLAVLEVLCRLPRSQQEMAHGVEFALRALMRWWLCHGYVFSGESGETFRLAHTHPLLVDPLREWACRYRF